MRRGAIAIVLGIVGGIALAGCGSSSGISLPCAPQPGGQLCIKVFESGLTVRDVIGYLAASDSPLAGKTWRLVLNSYTDCRGGGVVDCRVSAYLGPTRHGNPPLATSCRVINGSTVTAPSGCHDTLGAEYASHGDFTGLSVPTRFPLNSRLCVSEEIRSGGSWKTPHQLALACWVLS